MVDNALAQFCAIISQRIVHPSTLYIFTARYLAITISCTVQSSLNSSFIKLLEVCMILFKGLKGRFWNNAMLVPLF